MTRQLSRRLIQLMSNVPGDSYVCVDDDGNVVVEEVDTGKEILRVEARNAERGCIPFKDFERMRKYIQARR